jgi:predicted anti-sigma-YlaC factor YlaD
VDCGAAREAISALLDDEPLGVERKALERHLEACPACRRWREGAHAVTRRMRLAPARAGAPLADGMIADLLAGARPKRRRAEIVLTRAALAAVAVAQVIWVTVPALVFGDHGAPIHVSHEMGSFDMAVAVGFLVAAWRPARAQGMRALLGVAALLLVATAALDLAQGRTSVGDEVPHLLVVGGWLLLRHVAMLTPYSGVDPGLSLPRFLRVRERAQPVAAAQRQMADDGRLSGAAALREDRAA